MKKGLTIIEVMFSLTLVAVLMAATSPILLSSMRANGDSRVREQAISVADGWLDRFRASTLDFTHFIGGKEYPYDYDYANDDDEIFVAAGDPDVESLNREWQPFKFIVTTTQFSNEPRLIWQVSVETFYKNRINGEDGSDGSDGSFKLSTLITQ